MRYYLIFDNVDANRSLIDDCYLEFGGFQCSGFISHKNFELHRILKYQPEFVFINLDFFCIEDFSIIQRLNKAMCFPPNYIGITTCIHRGYDAFKRGFKDVILTPSNKGVILQLLKKHTFNVGYRKYYCISYYYDFQYISLSGILYLKADGYTTEIFTVEGNQYTNFKPLKYTHNELPAYFQRIHRSYVINSYYVRRIHLGKGVLYLNHLDYSLPISKTYSENIVTIKRYLLEE